MTDFLGAVILGLSFGSIYALLSVGLVLTYRTTGIFNLAFGPIAFFVAAVYYDTHVTHHWPMYIALLFSVGCGRAADRPRARSLLVPVPADGERDGEAGVGARPVRGGATDDLPVVRAERRSRTRSASCPNGSHTFSPIHNVFVSRDDLAIVVTGLIVFLGAHPDAPVHGDRSAHAGRGREPAPDRARGRERRAGEHGVVDALERDRGHRRRAADARCSPVRSGTRLTRRWWSRRSRPRCSAGWRASRWPTPAAWRSASSSSSCSSTSRPTTSSPARSSPALPFVVGFFVSGAVADRRSAAGRVGSAGRGRPASARARAHGPEREPHEDDPHLLGRVLRGGRLLPLLPREQLVDRPHGAGRDPLDHLPLDHGHHGIRRPDLALPGDVRGGRRVRHRAALDAQAGYRCSGRWWSAR